jgi:glycopeptide antibiotics resistance protein
MHTSGKTSTALDHALLTYMALVIAAITLIPFDFRMPQRMAVSSTGSIADIVENIVLFAPLGFLFQLTRRRTGWRPLLKAFCFGLLVSAVLEGCQLFLPERDSSVIDVATNGFGAGLGAAAAALLRAREQPAPASALFSFEMPLMNVVYLLIPLLWLGSLSVGGEIHRLLLLMLLGVFGGGVLASVYVNRMEVDRKPGGLMPAIYALAWFVIGTLPAVTAFPLEVLTLSAVAGAAAQLSAWCWKRGGRSERRFELSTLQRVFPLFGGYLILLSVWPTTLPLGAWPHGIDYRQFTELQRIVFTARFIEVIAAFTLLGYMVGEMRGRRNDSGLKTAVWVLGASLGFSILAAGLRDFLSGPLSSALEATIFSSAALYGALIYRLQLAAIKRMQAQQRLFAREP